MILFTVSFPTFCMQEDITRNTRQTDRIQLYSKWIKNKQCFLTVYRFPQANNGEGAFRAFYELSDPCEPENVLGRMPITANQHNHTCAVANPKALYALYEKEFLKARFDNRDQRTSL